MTTDHLDEALDRLHRTERTASPQLDVIRAKVLAAAEQRPRRRRPVLWLTAAAALALLAASQVVHPSSPPATRAPVSTELRISLASAPEFLNAAADLQIKTVDQPLRPGQYRYVVTHSYDLVSQQLAPPDSGYSYLVEHQQQLWIPADPHQQWVMRRQTPPKPPQWQGGSIPESQATPPTPTKTDIGEWRADCGAFFPQPDGKRPCDDPEDSESQAFYDRLSRDPLLLLAFMAAQTKAHGSTPLAEFRYAASVLIDGTMPADLRAAWYRAMAMTPGVGITADQATVDGRRGVAIGLSDADEQYDVIIDGSTGQFIGQREIAGQHSADYPWLKPGTLIDTTAVTTTIVNGIG